MPVSPGVVVREQWVTKRQAQSRERRDQRPDQGSCGRGGERTGLVGKGWSEEGAGRICDGGFRAEAREGCEEVLPVSGVLPPARLSVMWGGY